MAKKKTINYKTKQPTGLAFTRKSNVITLTWKCRDTDYEKAQQIAWNYWIIKKTMAYNKKTKKKDIATYSSHKTATSNGWRPLWFDTRSYNFTFDPKSFYPYNNNFLNLISISVRGQRKDFENGDIKYVTRMSDSTPIQYKVLTPSPPRVSAELSSEYSNVTKFSWECPDSGATARILTDYERQTILVANCNTADGKKVKWGKASTYTGTAKSHSVTEGTPFQGYYSYTRWYRVRCRGPRGVSEWRYARHVYAMPAYAKDVKAKVQASNRGRGYFRINVNWVANATVAHPIDKTVVQYLVTEPATSISTKTDKNGKKYRHVALIAPPMSSATDYNVSKDTGGRDGIVMTVPALSEENNCVVVRVNTHHDNNVGTGDTTYVTGSFGVLSEPTITSIGSVDPTTKRVRIVAENTSSVNNTHLAILYKNSAQPSKEICVGYIPKGETEATIILPDNCLTSSFTLGVQARLGDYSPVSYKANAYTAFTLSNTIMQSVKVWGEGTVPQPPKNITLTSPSLGAIRVTWDWSWLAATGAEISWSSHEDAWESTDQPQTYVVDNTSASSWIIYGLDIGTWYIRIRLFNGTGDALTYGAYSDTVSIKLSSAPATPALTLSDSVVSQDGSVTCYWVYTTTDGTAQNFAEICEAIQQSDGTFVYGNIIGRANAAQYHTLYMEDLGWKSGETHHLAVRVTSASGETSEGWSAPVSLAIADKIDIAVTDTSLVDKQEIIGEEIVYNYKALTKMPLVINVNRSEDSYSPSDDTTVVEGKTYYTRSGAGTEEEPYVYTTVENPEGNPSQNGYYEKDTLEGDVTIIIERAEGYHVDRPDETEFDGFEGETVAIATKSLDGSISIDREDLLGIFDDGAKYNLIAMVTDTYGQTSITEPLQFTVEWDHQAVLPVAEIEVFKEDIYSTILPIAPTGYEKTSDATVVEGKAYYTRSGSGTEEDPYIYTEVSSPSGNPKEQGYFEAYNSSNDSCDIYRLSVDGPELIVEDAIFGTKYVDPYPTLKEFGGYRVVYKTSYGDYITAENNLAWVDFTDEEHQIDRFATIIDFNKDRVILPYDIEIANKWSKDFTETKYLGGSVQGDWNPAVSRTGSVRTNSVVFEDPDTIKAMRKLADYAGICHVRTPDGSNFHANVDISEDRENKFVNKLAKFSIDITRVDGERLDGMDYDAWINDTE